MKQKIISLLLIIAVCISLVSCGDGEVSSSAPNGEETSAESGHPLTKDIAVGLLAQDEALTRIFINNELVNTEVANAMPVNPESEYSDYSAVEALINNTYLPSGGTKEFFESYPGVGEPAVSNHDGKSYVFYHAGSEYSDFISEVSIKIDDSDDPDKCSLTAYTHIGTRVTLDFSYSGGRWLLDKGLFRSLPEQSDYCNLEFPLSRIGSMSEFRGDILAIELYISDREGGFDPDEEEACSAKIKEALDYLAEQGERFGETANIKHERVYFEHNDILGTGVFDLDIMFAGTTLLSLEGLLSVSCDLDAYDNYVVFVCVDKNVATEAMRYDATETSELYYAERVTVTKQSTPSEIALCVLDLLGAYNYDGRYCDAYTTRLFASYFPNEIMLTKDIESGSVSPVTAYISGMTDELKTIYYPFFYNIEE